MFKYANNYLKEVGMKLEIYDLTLAELERAFGFMGVKRSMYNKSKVSSESVHTILQNLALCHKMRNYILDRRNTDPEYLEYMDAMQRHATAVRKKKLEDARKREKEVEVIHSPEDDMDYVSKMNLLADEVEF